MSTWDSTHHRVEDTKKCKHHNLKMKTIDFSLPCSQLVAVGDRGTVKSMLLQGLIGKMQCMAETIKFHYVLSAECMDPDA